MGRARAGAELNTATPWDLLRRAAGGDPARPLLTLIDEAGGERTEVSVATFENWVAKTANLLVDDLDVQPGTVVALALPLHWQTCVWLAACWATGALAAPVASVDTIDTVGAIGDADVVVAHTDRLTGLDPSAVRGRDVLALALRPFAVPGAGPLPAGVVDYDVEVRAHGDRFVPAPAPADRDPALRVAGSTYTGGDLVAAAEEAAARWGRPRRLLTTSAPDTLDGVLAALLVPLVLDGAAVLGRHLDGAGDQRLATLVATERIDARVPDEATRTNREG